jgi:hypothetical protein
MFSTLRNRFGIPGVISVIALVFAMFGGAYAASNSSGGGKATASAKAKKGPRGPKGATGPVGPQGPAGPAGPAGAKGDAGAAGAAGAPGATATAVSFSGPKGGCNEGGVEVKSAGAPTFVCNGEEGQQGQEGSPWPADGTLPAGETETGAYSITSETGAGVYPGFAITTISFPIPLSEALGASNAIYIKAEGTQPPAPDECQDTEHSGAASVGNPEAAPGFLCVFEGGNVAMATEMFFFEPSGGAEGTGVSGATLFQEPTAAEARAGGSWAVTAPLAS